MQLRRLRLVNFRQHADTVLEFDRGLTGIVGPNGAGKSTLLEAIAWAMYGTSAAKGNRDSIRRRSAPPRSKVEVELDFAIGAHQYRVVRSLQSAALYLDGEAAPIANSPSAVSGRVARLLGMTMEEFFNTYFTGQKELAVMASMSAPERARFLSRVLGYERLAVAQNRVREERSVLRAQLQTAETGLVDLEQLVAEEGRAAERLGVADQELVRTTAHRTACDQALAVITPEWQRLEERREQVRTIESDLQIADHSAVEARRAFETLDLALREALDAKARHDELLPTLADWDELIARRDRLEADSHAFAGRRAVEAEAAEVRRNAAALGERLAVLPGPDRLLAARDEIARAEAVVHQSAAALEELRNALVREKQNAETTLKGLYQQHDEVKEQKERLADAGAAGICPTCGKPLGKEYGAVLEDLESRLAVIVADGRHYRARIEQFAREPEGLVAARKSHETAEAELTRLTRAVGRIDEGVAERSRIEATRAELLLRLERLERQLAAVPTTYDEALHQSVRERITALEPRREQVLLLGARAERAVELVSQATLAEQALTRHEARAVSLRQELAALGWSAEAYELGRERIQAAQRERQAAELALVRAGAERSAAVEFRDQVARRRADRDRQAAEADRVRGELDLVQELDRAFSDLRDELNATLRPDLEGHASVLLQALTNDRYSDLVIGEDYSATIMDDGEPKPVISGGEEDVVNLALRLAISQMIAERAGQPFSMLILDEVFGSLDEERRTAVVDLLRALADRFPQVILITHIDSVREGFDRIVRIDYDAELGIARAREERMTIEESHVAA